MKKLYRTIIRFLVFFVLLIFLLNIPGLNSLNPFLNLCISFFSSKFVTKYIVSKYFKKLMVNYDLTPEKKSNSVFDRLIYLVKEKKTRQNKSITNSTRDRNISNSDSKFYEIKNEGTSYKKNKIEKRDTKQEKNINEVHNYSIDNSLIYEEGELFSIDFYHHFKVDNKVIKIVYETWRVTKESINIYQLDKKSNESLDYFLNPLKKYEKISTDYIYDSSKHELIHKKKNGYDSGDFVYKVDDFEFRKRYTNDKDMVIWNNIQFKKIGKKIKTKFKRENFILKKTSSLKINKLDKFDFNINIPEQKGWGLQTEMDLNLFGFRNINLEEVESTFYSKYDKVMKTSYYERFSDYFDISPMEEQFMFPLYESLNLTIDSNNKLSSRFEFTSFERKPMTEIKNEYDKYFTGLKILIEKGYDDYNNYFNSKSSVIQQNNLNVYNKGDKSLILDSDIYYKILKNNQERINKIDRDYVQKFIRLNNYLKNKFESLYPILDRLKLSIETRGKEKYFENEEEINFFRGLVYSHNLMVNHSIVMITSLVEDDTITFFEIYEVFDKINVFNTNLENEINNSLSEINESLSDINFSIRGLMNQMRNMEKKIVTGLNQINTSIGSLENSVNKQLSETNSRLKYENLTNYYKKSTLPGVIDWFDGPK